MIAVVDAPFNVHAEIRRPMHLPVVSDLAQHEDDGKHHSGLQALSLEVGQPWLGLELQAPFDHWDKTDLEASHPPRSAPPAHAAPLWVAAAPHTLFVSWARCKTDTRSFCEAVEGTRNAGSKLDPL